MDCPPYLLDIALLVSTTATCLTGVLCGWKIRDAAVRRRSENERPSAAVLDVSDFLATRPPLRSELTNDVGISAEDVLHATGALSEIVNQLRAEEAGMRPDSRFEELPSSDAILFALGQLAMDKEMLETQLRAAESRIDEQNRQLETVQSDAMTDALTGVGNRRSLDRELVRWTGTTPAAIGIIDIDDFKKLNDEHGHLAGDEVLRHIASLLATQYEGKASVSRYTGGMFAIVLDNCSMDHANDFLETSRTKIANQSIPYGKKTLGVTCSIGTTRLTVGEPLTEWLQRADDALYMSRFAGKNCGHCIDCHVIGKREKPYRLGAGIAPATVTAPTVPNAKRRSDLPIESPSQKPATASVLKTLPNVKALGENYHDLLRRMGSIRVDLSILAITVSEPDSLAINATESTPTKRLEKLFSIAKNYIRISDRIGFHDPATLLICMPGIGQHQTKERCETLLELAAHGLKLAPSEFIINVACAELGDSFESIVHRATARTPVIV